MLVWTRTPTLTELQEMKCGDKLFHCERKSKFVLNLQAICDNEGKLSWIFLKCDGETADCLSWLMYGLPYEIKNHEEGDLPMVLTGFTLFGKNAYIKTPHMVTPLLNIKGRHKNTCNFFQLQMRIKIKFAFGMIVHRWVILRCPLS
mmetsp:Transcript_37027/g.110890  ORF Transcript_37027/g.110890 Transcript_37027/m.110890 type:complete len:146 (+) Transcript_37027:731-1168(+)